MIRQNSTIKSFWMIFFGTVALLAIAVAVAVGAIASQRISRMRMSIISDENQYKIAQENGYRHSLYLACDSMKNIDADLGKIAVSHDAAHQTQMLAAVVIHANAVNQCLADLPLADGDNLAACQKFVNQTQDYATYLLGKLSGGMQLSVDERASLCNLDVVAGRLYGFLRDYAEGDSGMFMTNGNGAGNVGSMSDSLNDVEQNAFSYEKLIYDGPFSDSVERKQIAVQSRISPEQGQRIVSELFGSGTLVGELSAGGDMYLYDLDEGRVMLTCDGRVAQYEAYANAEGEIATAKCIEAAQQFCRKLGYDVQGVWAARTGGTTYVNCATVIDGVIVYPDLIKVAVGADGSVVGMEARAYLINHRDWDVGFGAVSQQEAQEAVDPSLHVVTAGKALVMKGDKYYLCHELLCERDGRRYYVYIDSNSGNEVELFKVVEADEGYTVM